MTDQSASSITDRARSFFVTGGTLRLDAPSYVERKADGELYRSLLNGEFCYVLTTRQMGKSSLMVRTATRLRREGATVAVIDLTAIGRNLTPEQWYDGLRERLGQQLRLEDEIEEEWYAREAMSPLRRWTGILERVMLPRCGGRIVLFIDEIDATRGLPFSTDEFFAAIRECYNRRALEPEWERLTFCLLGVAAPTDLIADSRTTPFNIGRRIELHDFTPEEAAVLAEGLGRVKPLARALLKRVLYWTNGHPYLTQRLCSGVAENPKLRFPGGVDQLCRSLFLATRAKEHDDNLTFVRERMLQGVPDVGGLLTLYRRIRQRKPVKDDETDPRVGILRLSGIVRSEYGRLVVRNRIYETVFDDGWIVENMPKAELRRQAAAYRRGIARTISAFGAAGALLAAGGALWLRSLDVDPRLTIQAPRGPSPNAYVDYREAARSLDGEPVLDMAVDGKTGLMTIIDQPPISAEVPRQFTMARFEPREIPPDIARKLVGENKQALNRLRTGLKRTCLYPFSSSYADKLRFPADQRRLAHLLLLEAETKFRDRDWSGASESLTDLVVFGEDLARGAPLSYKILGDIVQVRGLEALVRATLHLDAASSRRALSRLAALEKRRVTLAEAYEQEKRLTQAALLRLFHRSDWRSRYHRFLIGDEDARATRIEAIFSFLSTLPFSERRLMSNYSAMMDEWISRARKPYGSHPRQPNPPEDPFCSVAVPVFLTGEANASPIDPLELDMRASTFHLFARLSLALRLHEIEHGSLPASLAGLNTRRLPDNLIDPATRDTSVGYRTGPSGYTLFTTQQSFHVDRLRRRPPEFRPFWDAPVSSLAPEFLKRWPRLPARESPPVKKGLLGRYYSYTPDNSPATSSQPGPLHVDELLFTREDPQINFKWVLDPPRKDSPSDHFVVRWDGKLLAPETGLYHFVVESDDGVRLTLDGLRLIDDWFDRSVASSSADVWLDAGWHRVDLEYYDRSLDAILRLKWNHPFGEGMRVIPPLNLGHDASSLRRPPRPPRTPSPGGFVRPGPPPKWRGGPSGFPPSPGGDRDGPPMRGGEPSGPPSPPDAATPISPSRPRKPRAGPAPADSAGATRTQDGADGASSGPG